MNHLVIYDLTAQLFKDFAGPSNETKDSMTQMRNLHKIN